MKDAADIDTSDANTIENEVKFQQRGRKPNITSLVHTLPNNPSNNCLLINCFYYDVNSCLLQVFLVCLCNHQRDHIITTLSYYSLFKLCFRTSEMTIMKYCRHVKLNYMQNNICCPTHGTSSLCKYKN